MSSRPKRNRLRNGGKTSDFTEPIPLAFLHEGQNFRYEKPNGESLLARTIMDGNAVSKERGVLAGQDFYTVNPQRDYINIQFDVAEYSGDWRKDSDTIYHRDGGIVYIRPSDVPQYQRDLAAVEEYKRGNAKAEEKRKIEDDIRRAEAALTEARKRLERL